MTIAYIAIGSNLASPLEQVNAAVEAIGAIPESRIIRVSSFYRTPPLGPQDQPDYLNAAVALETALTPDALLNHAQRIELQQGRQRKAERWGPYPRFRHHAVWSGNYSYRKSDRPALRHVQPRLYAVAAVRNCPEFMLP